MRVQVDVSSNTKDNIKTTTATTSTFITVRDLIGYAKSGIALAMALKAALQNQAYKKIFQEMGIAGLVAPLVALAFSLEIVQKIVGVLAMVMPVAQIVAAWIEIITGAGTTYSASTGLSLSNNAFSINLDSSITLTNKWYVPTPSMP